MNKYFLISLILLTTLFGCRQKQDFTKRYYIIEIPVDQNINLRDTLKSIDKYCEISTADISPAFASHRIAVRENSHEIEYFRNHEWATRPANNLTAIIVEFFERYGLFKGTDTRYWRIIPEYRFETRIYQLEAVQNSKRLSAHLNLEFRLIDKQTNKVIIKHSADRYKELEENNINLFAAAISELFYQELTNMSIKISNTVNQ